MSTLLEKTKHFKIDANKAKVCHSKKSEKEEKTKEKERKIYYSKYNDRNNKISISYWFDFWWLECEHEEALKTIPISTCAVLGREL